jgi:hypothetical protein
LIMQDMQEGWSLMGVSGETFDPGMAPAKMS